MKNKDGIEVNAKQVNGATPLYLAAHNGHVEVVKSLLKVDAYSQLNQSVDLHCEVVHSKAILVPHPFSFAR